ncbi:MULTISPECIES: hypothetical protein [Bacteria]|jgi:uncharacterized membrane protein
MDEAGAADRRRPLTILAFTAVAFVALLVFGLGVTSLMLNQAVIAEPGLSQAPGIVGTILATVGFSAVCYPGLHARAGTGAAVLSGIAAAAGYVVGVAFGAFFAGADPLLALGVAAGLAVSWPALVVGVAGVVAAASALAIVRAGPGGARWPWERDED